MERAAKKNATRRRILENAREVFFAHGFERANLDEIARRADLAKGTIYRYFDSKAALYVAVLAENAHLFVARMRQTLDPELDPEAQIRKTALFYFRHYVENREYFRIFWAIENQLLIGQLSDEVVATVTEVWKRCLQILSAQIERGVGSGVFLPCDPWAVANLLWIIGNGLIQTEQYPERRALRAQPLEKVFEASLSLVLRGLRAGP